MRIHLPFVPVACPRPKVSIRGGFARAYYPKKYAHFKDTITKYLQKEYQGNKFEKGCPVYIEYLFILPRPKALQRKSSPEGRIPHTKKPDLDNLMKSINDGLEGSGILENDSIGCFYKAEKWIAAKGEESHIQLFLHARYKSLFPEQ